MNDNLKESFKHLLSVYMYQLYFEQVPQYIICKNKGRDISQTFNGLLVAEIAQEQKNSTSESKFSKVIEQMTVFVSQSIKRTILPDQLAHFFSDTFLPDQLKDQSEKKKYEVIKMVLCLSNQHIKDLLQDPNVLRMIKDQSLNGTKQHQKRLIELLKDVTDTVQHHMIGSFMEKLYGIKSKPKQNQYDLEQENVKLKSKMNRFTKEIDIKNQKIQALQEQIYHLQQLNNQQSKKRNHINGHNSGHNDIHNDSHSDNDQNQGESDYISDNSVKSDNSNDNDNDNENDRVSNHSEQEISININVEDKDDVSYFNTESVFIQ